MSSLGMISFSSQTAASEVRKFRRIDRQSLALNKLTPVTSLISYTRLTENYLGKTITSTNVLRIRYCIAYSETLIQKLKYVPLSKIQ